MMAMQHEEEEEEEQQQQPLMLLPLGYKFRPTHQELLFYFLKNKLKDPTAFQPASVPIYDVQLYDHHPKIILDQFGGQEHNEVPECYVFTMRHRKFLRGDRANRILKDNVGYWRASYKNRTGDQFHEHRRCGGGLVGERMNLVYYDTTTTSTTYTSDKKNGMKKGTKTHWLMNEYKIKPATDDDGAEEDLVLCKIYTNNRQKDKGISNHQQQQYNMQQELPYLQQQQQQHYMQQEQQYLEQQQQQHYMPQEQPCLEQEQYMQQEQPHLLQQQQQQQLAAVDDQAASNTGTYSIGEEIDAHTFWDMSLAPEPQQTGMGMISIDDYAQAPEPQLTGMGMISIDDYAQAPEPQQTRMGMISIDDYPQAPEPQQTRMGMISIDDYARRVAGLNC